jgi:hypothetical protein
MTKNNLTIKHKTYRVNTHRSKILKTATHKNTYLTRLKTKKNASKKIIDFMKRTEEKRKSNYLNIICADSGECLAVGIEIDRIRQFFNRFINFKYAINPIRSIGTPSANGFIKEIAYTRDGYNSYALLKSSQKPNSDNLMYEYEVGKNFINKQNKYFSCFLETYGLFIYENPESWNSFKDANVNKDLLNSLMIIPVDYKTGCKKSQYIAILIQHLNNAISFDKFIRNALAETNLVKKKYELNFDVFYILYQIYFVLDVLKDEFTHYDLHTDNVLLYEPVKNGYITYHYHLKSGATVEFHSKYIAKIIDYGRCYYYENDVNNSKKTYDRTCSITDCEPNCGEDSGFAILGPEAYPGSFYYISSQVRNKSHDLRLAYIIKDYIMDSGSIMSLNANILQSIVYETDYGTPELENGAPNAIHNVTDMRMALESFISIGKNKTYNDKYGSTLTKIGDMHIYEDRRPMEYVKLTRP